MAFVMLFGPQSFHSLSQAEVQYANLNTASWAQGNRDIHYSYDDNGSLTEKITAIKDEPDPQTYFEEKVTSTYNLQNRLAQIVRQYDDTGDTIEEFTEYTYNDNGIRVSKHTWSEINDTHQNDDVTVVYLVDSYNHTGYAQVFVEDDGTNQTSYIIGDDVLAQATNSNAPEYLLYDGHGSTRQLVDSTGTGIVDSFSYDAYGVMLGGNPTRSAPAATNLLYAGEQFDTDAQQYYLRARYYDQNTGRFNRMDTFSGNNYDPQSLHKYLYVHNNPVNNIDPSGKFLGAADVSVTMAIRISIQALIITVGAVTAWKKFGPKGHKPDANQQRQINAAKLVIQNNLLNKKFMLDSGQEIVIDYEYVGFDNYYVWSSGYRYGGEHRPWPFQRIILDENVWFAMSPELGACTMVHELYHYFHWGFGTMEEKAAHELEAQVYIELGLPRSGAYWDDIVEASQNYDFPLPE